MRRSRKKGRSKHPTATVMPPTLTMRIEGQSSQPRLRRPVPRWFHEADKEKCEGFV